MNIGRGARTWGGACLVAAAAVVSILLTRPPAPRPADAPPEQFSAARAFEHVRRIARVPHPAGSAAEEPVRAYLVTALYALGIEAEARGGFGPGGRYVNLVARRPGSGTVRPGAAKPSAVLLVAHYDSVPAGPGAGDDAASVAAVLETLRALGATSLRNDVVVLFADAEERGLVGARAFASRPENLEGVGLVLNFEARGNAGPALMFETSDGAGRLVEEFASVAPRPGANSLMAGVYRRMPNDTDFSVFRDAGIPGLNFAFIEGYTAYHRPTDTPENLSLESLEHQGETMLATVRRFGDLDLGDLRADDAVYFDVLGTWVIRYPVGWTWPLTVAAAALLGVVILRGRRRVGLRLGRAAAGAGLFVATIAFSCLAACAVSQALLRALHDKVSRPAMGTTGDAWFFGAMTLAALAVAAWTFRRFAPRLGGGNLAAGALFVWLVLLVVVNVVMPGGTFLFLWPLALGSVALALRPRASVLAACGVTTAIVVAPMAQRLFVAMALDASPIGVALVSLSLGALLPSVEPLVTGERSRLPLAALLAAAACVAAGVATA